jgi:hypothetical protein
VATVGPLTILGVSGSTMTSGVDLGVSLWPAGVNLWDGFRDSGDEPRRSQACERG